MKLTNYTERNIQTYENEVASSSLLLDVFSYIPQNLSTLRSFLRKCSITCKSAWDSSIVMNVGWYSWQYLAMPGSERVNRQTDWQTKSEQADRLADKD